MRILLLTEDRETEQRFSAAAQSDAAALTVLHSEAQALERMYRDPFDAVLLDIRSHEYPFLVRRSALWEDRLFLLLPQGVRFTPETAVICGFDPSCPPKTVLSRIGLLLPERMSRRFPEPCLISSALQSVGVPTHMEGFGLLAAAIRLALHQKQPVMLRMQQDVYARIAESSRKSPSAVEHAMRHAIDAAWLRADARVLERLFGYTVSADRGTPSNESFIFQMREHIRIRQREGDT